MRNFFSVCGTQAYGFINFMGLIFSVKNSIHINGTTILILPQSSKRFFSFKNSTKESYQFFIDFLKLNLMTIQYFILTLR